MKDTVLRGKNRENDMGSQKKSEIVPSANPPKKADRIEVVKVLVLAVVSFVLGFGLVIFFLGPSDTSQAADLDLGGKGEPSLTDAVKTEVPSEAPEQLDDGKYAPGTGDNPLLSDKIDDAEPSAGEGDAPQEVPPGRTPEGVGLKGDAFYLKCWDGSGNEVAGTSCDTLRVLEKRFSTRLYVVDRCKQTHAGEKADGVLSLGMEVDFDNKTLSFWNGASSDLENAAKVATCLRTELAGLPIHSVDHKYSRYRLFFTVVFGKNAALTTAADKADDKEEPSAKKASDTPLPKGKMVNVVMDRVRVRKSPENGDVIGMISSGNQVELIRKKSGWCEVVTPNNNRGWMTCEALSK
jgi:hypothetical protein